jgi:hypothetical protein
MNEERMKVLEMVADGTISADDASKLLDALNASGGKHHIRPPHTRKHRRGGTPFQGVFHAMGDIMGEVMKEMRVGFGKEGIPEDAEEVPGLDEVLPEGYTVAVRRVGRNACGSTGSVTVIRGAEGRLVARPKESDPIRVSRSENEVRIYIGEGDLELEVPETAASLDLALKAGSVSVQGLHCPLRARTMGGGIRVVRPESHFSVKTMGGSLELVLGPEWNGGSKAKTMGGGVSVELLKGVSARVDASTMGGAVEVSGATVLEDKSSPGSSRKLVEAGDGENPSVLVVKTMGGGVTVRGGDDV